MINPELAHTVKSYLELPVEITFYSLLFLILTKLTVKLAYDALIDEWSYRMFWGSLLALLCMALIVSLFAFFLYMLKNFYDPDHALNSTHY